MAKAVRLSVHLLSVGYCRHCERVTIAGGSWRPVSFPSICALIVHPREGALLYDTGYAERFADNTRHLPECLYRWFAPVTLPPGERLAARLAGFGLRLRDVRTCLISHFHADHISGLRDLELASFVALRADLAVLDQRRRYDSLARGFLPGLLPDDFQDRLSYAEDCPQRPLGPAWEALGQGFDLFGDGSLRAVPLPGHSAGHMGLVLRDELDREVLLCADACWSRAAWEDLRLPSRLARPLMHDWGQYVRTLHRLHDLGTQHPEVSIVPSHCEISRRAYEAGMATVVTGPAAASGLVSFAGEGLASTALLRTGGV